MAPRGDNNGFSENLRRERLARKVSQSSLSRRTGVPQSAISRIETGREVPSLERFNRLLAGLGLRAAVEIEPLAYHGADAQHRAYAMERLTPGERLEQAAGWGALVEEIRGKAA